jgi:hypothetical protein
MLIDWLLRILIALAQIADGLVALFTLCLWRPSWSLDVRLWLLHWRCRDEER